MDDKMDRPPSFALADEDVKAFADITARQTKLAAQQASVREFMKTVVQTGEARLSEVQIEANTLGRDLRKLWEAQAKKHGFDLQKVAYDLSEDGKTLIPIQVRL